MRNSNEVIKDLLDQRSDYLFGGLEFSSDGVFIADIDGNTLYINPAYEEISGLKRLEILGKNLKTLYRKMLLMNRHL